MNGAELRRRTRPDGMHITNRYGVRAHVYAVELLPNGKWRIEFASGLVELRDHL